MHSTLLQWSDVGTESHQECGEISRSCQIRDKCTGKVGWEECDRPVSEDGK